MATVSPQSAEPPLVLTIDVGTSSTRAMLFDRHGRAVEGVDAQEQSGVRVPAEGASEQDPDEALERIARCVDAALKQAGALADAIAAVAVATLATTTLALDQAGRPLTPLLTYADTRCTDDAANLRKQLDERAVHDRTGCLLRASYWPARLVWLRRTQPEVWRSAARWITLGELLELHLFGQSRVSFSAASWSGLLDRRQLVWDAPLLDTLGLTLEQLAPLVDRDAPLQGLCAPFAARWPALRNLPWFPAIGDGAASNIGSGCGGPERIALNMGTSGALRVVLSEVAHVADGLWCYRVDRRRALLGGATSEGGNVFAWLRQTLRLDDPTTEQALAALPPDGHGLTVLPFLAGERSPGWAGDVKATISGLSLTTTPIDILRACLESVAYRFALILELMGGDTQAQIVAGGGVLHSPAWLQIIADTLGRPVTASAEPETTSCGTAILALHALGALPDPAVLPADTGATYIPDPARHACYRAAIERQRELYRLLVGSMQH